MDPRRDVKFENTPVTLALELLASVVGVLPLAWVTYYWKRLPDRVPAHFGAGGQVDGWAEAWTMWMIPALCIVMLAVLLLVVRRATWYNVPVKLTPQNVHKQLHLARWLVYAILIWSLMLLAWISFAQVQISMGRSQSLGGAFLGLFLTVEVGILAWYFTAARRARNG